MGAAKSNTEAALPAKEEMQWLQNRLFQQSLSTGLSRARMYPSLRQLCAVCLPCYHTNDPGPRSKRVFQ